MGSIRCKNNVCLALSRGGWSIVRFAKRPRVVRGRDRPYGRSLPRTQGGPDWVIDDRFRPNPRQIDNQGLRHIRWIFGDYYWNPELPAVPTPTARTHAAPTRGGPDTTAAAPGGPQTPEAPPPRGPPGGGGGPPRRPLRGTARHTAPIRGTSRVAPVPLNPKPLSGSCWPPTATAANNSRSPRTPARSASVTLWPVNRCARFVWLTRCCPHEPITDPLNVLRRSKMADRPARSFQRKNND